MKVGDLVEVYRHIPRYESGEVPVGKMGTGVIIGITQHDTSHWKPSTPNTVISYVSSETGNVESEWVGGEHSGVIVTMKVISEVR